MMEIIDKAAAKIIVAMEDGDSINQTRRTSSHEIRYRP